MFKYSSQLPLKERVLKSSCHQSTPFHVESLGRPQTFKHWTEAQMKKAIDAVQNQHYSFRRAAEEYGVPRQTLHDHVSGHVQFGQHSGPPRYLTDEEEDELENFLTGCASIGFARSRQQVIAVVQEVVNRKGMRVTVTQGWWDSYKRRHPILTLRTASPLSYARAVANNQDVIDNYYTTLKQALVENEIMEKPTQIFNLDETGMPLDPPAPRVVARKGQKHPTAIGSGDKSQITVLACCSAAGYTMPPFVIFDRKNLKPEYTVGEIPGTLYGLSKNGRIDSE